MANDSLGEKIVDELGMFEIRVDDPIFVPDKAADICTQHFGGNVDDFISDLVAYRMNRGVGDDKPLTQEFLDSYERWRLSRQEADLHHSSSSATRRKTNAGHVKTPTSSRATSIRTKPRMARASDIYQDYGLDDFGETKIDTQGGFIDAVDEDESEPMDSAETFPSDCRTPSKPIIDLDPETFSPAGFTPSQHYAERSNSSKIECSFGLAVQTIDWTRPASESNSRSYVGLVRVCDDLAPVLDCSHRYMDQNLRSIQVALTDRSASMKDELVKLDPSMEARLAESNNVDEGQTLVVGTLFNGDDNERPMRLIPDKTYIRFEKSNTLNEVAVDLSNIADYSLFSGESVALDGKMVGKDRFIAEKLIPGVPPPSTTPISGDFPDRLSVVVACGPFTPSDGFGYEPLVDLLKYVHKHRPHALILIGPIVPASRDDILSLELPVEDVFQHVMSRVADACSRCNTQLIVVASAEDATMDPCYPTAPPATDFDKNRVQFVADPCLLRIGGLVFGLTATDVLFHLSSEEMKSTATEASGDRMSRLIRHLLLQRTFYPLCPSMPEFPMDVQHWKTYAAMPTAPHVLFLPSALKCFLKDVDNVLTVNPGHLTKGRGGGTFCRLEFDRRKMAHENGNVSKCLNAQVLRI